MEAIAEAAGVPKSTLYNRHPDKMSVLRAVFEDRIAVWSKITARRNHKLTADLEQRLKHHAETIVIWSASEEVRAFTRLAAGVWASAPEVAQMMHEIGYTTEVSYLEREIREFGSAVIKDPRTVAAALMALLAGWQMTIPLNSNVPRMKSIAFAHRAVELLIHGKSAW